MKEPHKALFIGRKTVFVGTAKVEDNKLMLRKPKFGGFSSEWQTIHGAVDLEKYEKFQEKQLFDVNQGRTERTIRVYFVDLDSGEEYAPMMNTDAELRINSLMTERNTFMQKYFEAMNYIEDSEVKDQFKAQFKAEYEFYQNMKPGYMFNNKDKGKKK